LKRLTSILPRPGKAPAAALRDGVVAGIEGQLALRQAIERRERLPGRGKIEVSRFKGLGEMPARYLKATTMDPAQRILLRVTLPQKPDPAAIELPDEEYERTRLWSKP